MKITLRKKLALGEVDYKTHCQILLPVEKTGKQRNTPEPEKVWVKIVSGSKTCGRGIIDHEPREATKFKLGQVVAFKLHRGDIYPKFTKRVHVKNQTQTLLDGLAQTLRDSMTFNPNFGRDAYTR